MGWDAARVAAAVPSGVGFLGAGLIWKGSTGESGNEKQEVHGLTTAASVWLSAAVGVAIGGGQRLYIVSIYAVALVVLVLRFGPQMYMLEDSDSMADYDDDTELDWTLSDDESYRSQIDDIDDEKYALPDKLGHIDGEELSGYVSDHKQVRGEEEKNLDVPKSPSSQHSKVPEMASQIYETPIIDHSLEDPRSPGGRRKKNKSRGNNHTLSFHG